MEKEISLDRPTSDEVAVALESHTHVVVVYSDKLGVLIHHPLAVAKLLVSKFGDFKIKEYHFEGSDSYPSKIDFVFQFLKNGKRLSLSAHEQLDLGGFWNYSWSDQENDINEEDK